MYLSELSKLTGTVMRLFFLVFLSQQAWSHSCKELNVTFPIKVNGQNLYCSGAPGIGSKGVVFALVDSTGKETDLGIKVFYETDKKLIADEVNEVSEGTKAKLPIPRILASFDGGTQPQSNYIVKEFVRGADANDLYMHGCFLETKSADSASKCSILAKTSAADLLAKFGSFLERLISADREYFKPQEKFPSDMHGENIRWDSAAKEFKLIDYTIGSNKGIRDKKDAAQKISEYYGWLLFRKTSLTSSEICHQKKAIEEIMKKYIKISNPVQQCPK